MHHLTRKAVIALGVLTAAAFLQFMLFGDVSAIFIWPIVAIGLFGIVRLTIDMYGDFAKTVEQFNRDNRYRTSYGRRVGIVMLGTSLVLLLTAIYFDIYWLRSTGYKLGLSALPMWWVVNHLPFRLDFYFARKQRGRLNI